jgi:uncharacterized lipoprotein YmbA
MSPFLWRLVLVTLVGSLLGLGACANTPSRFYMLSPLTASETVLATAAARGLVVGVGPISVPKYLDRPQIVTRASRNQLDLGEFDRWAEPLQDNVLRVLAENLMLLIPTDHILLGDWPRSASLDYQVRVEVLHFDGWFGGESTLLALWSILDRAERPLMSQRVSLSVPVGGRDYEALVMAMNQMLEALSRDIAAAIQRLASRAVVREETAVLASRSW